MTDYMTTLAPILDKVHAKLGGTRCNRCLARDMAHELAGIEYEDIVPVTLVDAFDDRLPEALAIIRAWRTQRNMIAPATCSEC